MKEKFSTFIIEQIVHNNLCFVLGTNELIKKFSSGFEIEINLVTTDFKPGETMTIEAFDPETEKVMTLGLVEKSELELMFQKYKPKGIRQTSPHTKDILGLILRKEHKIEIVTAKPEKGIEKTIREIFNLPEEEKKHNKYDESYLGYA